MSGAEALAVIGIVSNILQVADFCSKLTDRAVEFAGRSAELPGSFSDLRVVLAVVRLNLKKLNRRLESSHPDPDTLETLQDLVIIIEREANVIQTHLKKLPPPGSSWAKVTLKAIISVFTEGRVKKATESIMQNVDLLSQTVTASLPTAEEIAKAVHEKSMNSSMDRKLSMILERMKTSAVHKDRANRTAFAKQAKENRSSHGQDLRIQGETHINNTYITLNIPYKDLGAQLDKNGGNLSVPNKDLPFFPLKHAISNPSLPKVDDILKVPEASIIAAPMMGATLDSPMELKYGDYLPPGKAARSNTTKTYHHSSSKSEIWDDSHSIDGDTVVGSIVSSQVGLSVPHKLYTSQYHHMPKTYPPPKQARHLSESFVPLHKPDTIPEENLYNSVHEIDGLMSPLTQTMSPSVIDDTSEAGTASDVHSDMMQQYSNVGSDMSTTITSSTAMEDTAAINTVNAYLRQGAAAVTSNPTEAKRYYLSAMSACKGIVTYTSAFTVRKYRAMTAAAIGLALSTQDREAYLAKARLFNQQALSTACQSKDDSLEFKVLLDEAELQMREARMLEKSGRSADATMKQFTAFGAYQGIAKRVSEAAMARVRRSSVGNSHPAVVGGSTYPGVGSSAPPASSRPMANTLRCMSVADCNTQAQALIGSGKAATLMAKNAGRFSLMNGADILTPRAYFEQALAACKAGVEVGAQQAADAQARGDPDWARRPAEELALLRETEELIMRLLVT